MKTKLLRRLRRLASRRIKIECTINGNIIIYQDLGLTERKYWCDYYSYDGKFQDTEWYIKPENMKYEYKRAKRQFILDEVKYMRTKQLVKQLKHATD